MSCSSDRYQLDRERFLLPQQIRGLIHPVVLQMTLHIKAPEHPSHDEPYLRHR